MAHGPNALEPRPALLRASALDAANAHMRKAGRKRWNRSDADVASATLNRLVLACYGDPSDTDERIAWVRFSEVERSARRAA